MPSVHGVVQEAGTPLPPSTSTRHIRHEPNALRESVAHSLGMVTPASVGGPQHGRAGGDVDRCAVDGDVHGARCRVTAGVPRSGSGCQVLCCHRARPLVDVRSARSCRLAVEVLGEVPDRALHRHRGQAAHGAQRALASWSRTGRRGARGWPSTSRPAMIRSMTSRRRGSSRSGTACTCRRTPRAELHREAGHPGHVDGVVEDHDAAVADHRAGLRRTPRSPSAASKPVGRDVRAERAADLDGAHRPAGPGAAAVVLDELAQGHPERQLDDAAAA